MPAPYRPLRHWLITSILSASVILGAIGVVHAARPSAASLLPDNTVAFVSVADTRDLSKRFMETAIGRMSQQEKIKPLVTQLYQEVQDLAAPLEDWIGLTLADLLAVPQGELTLAVVAPKGEIPAFVGLLDVKEQVVAVETMLDKADKVLRENEAVKSLEKAGETSIVVYKMAGSAQRQVAYFEREGTLVVGTNLQVLRKLLAAWDGEGKETLATNKKYTTIMDRCRGSRKDRPQITWFSDPLGLVRSLSQNNTAVQIGLTLLEEKLGLKGLQGVGGSLTFATTDPAAQFDSISHVHILLDNPRQGAIKVFALGSGDAMPEKWVPRDVASYATFHWQLKTTYKELGSIINAFAGEGFTAQRVQAGFSQIGLDFEKEFLPAIDNRFSHFTWIQRPVTPTSQMQVFAVKLKDGEASRPLLEKVMTKLEARFEPMTSAGRSYYRFIPPGPAPKDGSPQLRFCVGLLGDYVLFSDQQGAMEQAIKTSLGQGESLGGAADYRLIASQAARQSGGAQPAMVAFNRPEEGMRFMYDLVSGERQFLRRRRRGQPLCRARQQGAGRQPLATVRSAEAIPGAGRVGADRRGHRHPLHRVWPQAGQVMRDVLIRDQKPGFSAKPGFCHAASATPILSANGS